tara:strand:- start:905 stop:1072 length:168 start_codon:yes stop_codon:yes gene_type:complete
LFTIWRLAGQAQFLLRRAVYIKHPPQVRIALKQKKDCARAANTALLNNAPRMLIR